MTVDRKLILEKLTVFLDGKMTPSQLYQWALSVVVSREYERYVKNDKLAQEIFHYLIDIEKSKSDIVPTKKVLGYYIRCLEGKSTPVSENYKLPIAESTVSAEPRIEEKAPASQKPSVFPAWLSMAAKIYVLIFVVVSFCLNGVCMIKPDLFVRSNEIAPTALETARESLPHFFYGALILTGMFAKVSRIVYWGFIAAGIWGIFLYGSIVVAFFSKYRVSVLSFFILVLLIALPPVLALCVIINRWLNQPKVQNVV